MDMVIRNGTIVTANGEFRADVGIDGERIVALMGQNWEAGHDRLRGKVELDARGCYVLPGGVDPHVHLQMPAGAYTSADDFTTGTVASALGGTTTVIDFVEPMKGETLTTALASRRAEADGRVAVDYGLHMTIPAWHAARQQALEGVGEVTKAGVSSFKLYLAYAGFQLDDAALFRALETIAANDGLPIVHCENGTVCDLMRAGAVSRGRVTPIYHAHTRPPRQEAEAVSRVIDLAALVEHPVYIVHVSCSEALARIEGARARGDKVYAETCPQYLLLNVSALDQPGGERMVCSPPLRTEKDNAALWEALASGALDILATDHCPFPEAEKRDHADFTTIPGGLPSIQARLSLGHHFGQQHGLTLQRWVQVCCTSPARIFGLRTKGHIAPGFDADLVIFDPQQQVTLAAGETLRERVDWSPYEGMTIQGWPRDVLCRGRLVVREGAYVGDPGWGRFVAREP